MRPRIKEATEKQIENSILEYLEVKGIFCWKHNNTGIYDTRKQTFRRSYSRYQFPGIADIIGIMPCGKLLALEVKKPSRVKNTTLAQKKFLANIEMRNGVCGVVTSIEDVDGILKRYARNSHFEA